MVKKLVKKTSKKKAVKKKKIIRKKDVTPKTPLNDIMKKGDKAVEILFESGLHCIGCPMSMQETLEQGCMAHGMSESEIKKIVDKINKVGKK